MSREIFRTANRSLLVRKYAPERLQAILTYVAEMPVIADTCRRAGISRSSLIYYLAKSERGKPGDGFDLPTGDFDDNDQPIKRRFHELWADALEDGIDKVERAAHRIAVGQPKPLTNKYGVIYKLDQDKLDLGLTDMEAYLHDEHGKPIPETIIEQDPDMMRFILKTRRQRVYGDHTSVDMVHSGGVLVVGVKKTEAELEAAYGGKQEIQDVEFEDVTDDTDTATAAAMAELE
jgi:hypothetical protein